MTISRFPNRRPDHALGLMLVSASIFVFLPIQASAGPQPSLSWSFYIETTNTSTLNTLGCNQAAHDASVQQNSMVILDFGGLNADGSQQNMWSAGWQSSNTTAQLAEWFAYGYGHCGSGGHSTILVVGTNNSIDENTSNGSGFANTVKTVNQYTQMYFPQVSVWGGNDIETWSDSTVTGGDVYNWYNGYSAAGGPLYVNFGSADGCDATNWTCYAYNNSNFNKGDYYNFSWGFSLAEGTPEIYNGTMAQQWDWIETATQSMSPKGPLNTTSGYNSGQAWQALNQYFPSLSYSLCINGLGTYSGCN